MKRASGDVLDAYRADLSNAQKEYFTESDGLWLKFGSIVQRASELAADHRLSYLADGLGELELHAWPSAVLQTLRQFAVVVAEPEPDSTTAQSALSAVILAIAKEAENAGAYAVATTLLDIGRALIGLTEFLLQGRFLAQQARIFRKLSELDVALELYEEVDQLSAVAGEPELRARAALGRGVVARVRGNYPKAREEFLIVIGCEPRNDEIRGLHANAYHGLLIGATVAEDFESALMYGARAVELAREPEHHAELLVNLSSVCQYVGQSRAALNGYLRALGEAKITRVRLTALGGAADSAARLGERGIVEDLVREGMSLAATAGLPYEVADMLREFGEAWALLDDDARASRLWNQAMEMARRGGFFEIEHRIEKAMQTRATLRTPPRLAPEAMAVAAHLADEDSHRLLVAAISSGHPGS